MRFKLIACFALSSSFNTNGEYLYIRVHDDIVQCGWDEKRVDT